MTKSELYSHLVEVYGKTKANKFSDRFLDTIVHDANKKQDNLRWLMGDKTRIEFPVSNDVIKIALSNSDEYVTFKKFTELLGFTIDDIVAGKIVKDGNIYSISSIGKMRITMDNALKSVITKQNLCAIRPKHSNNSYRSYPYTIEDYSVVKDYGDFIIVEQDNKVYKIPKDKLDHVSPNYDFHHLSREVSRIITDSSAIVLSTDIRDFITCSRGSISSCFSETNMHHLGWVQNFRADFSLIAFTHSSEDILRKTGRFWVYARALENGLPFDTPFFKIQKSYGKVTDQNRDTIINYIKDKAKSNLNLKFTYRDFDSAIKQVEVSPNLNHFGTSHSSFAGYLDTKRGSNAPEYRVDNSDKTHGVSCLYNFPDAIGYDGLPTNDGNFESNQTGLFRSSLGVVPIYKYVTCEITKESVLDVDAIKLADGKWYSKSALSNTILGTAIEKDEIVVVEEDISDIEIDIEEF